MSIFTDKGIYRLGKSTSLRMDRGARDELRRLMLEKGVRPAADRIAARCNEASSWGSYEARHGNTVSWVAARRAGADSNRGRRILTAANGAADLL